MYHLTLRMEHNAFQIKNAHSEFQNIMNDIFNPYTTFTIVYIDNVWVYSNSIEQQFKHLNIFLKLVKNVGLVVSAWKMKFFQTKVRLLGHNIHKRLILPIYHAIIYVDKFLVENLDKKQL